MQSAPSALECGAYKQTESQASPRSKLALCQNKFSPRIAHIDISHTGWLNTDGAVAQLGERMTGSHEVRGSIPLGSTNSRFNAAGKSIS